MIQVQLRPDNEHWPLIEEQNSHVQPSNGHQSPVHAHLPINSDISQPGHVNSPHSTVNSSDFPILHRDRSSVQVDAGELRELTNSVVSLRNLVQDLAQQQRASEARLDARIGELEFPRRNASIPTLAPSTNHPAANHSEHLPSAQSGPPQQAPCEETFTENRRSLPVKRRTPERNALMVSSTYVNTTWV